MFQAFNELRLCLTVAVIQGCNMHVSNVLPVSLKPHGTKSAAPLHRTAITTPHSNPCFASNLSHPAKSSTPADTGSAYMKQVEYGNRVSVIITDDVRLTLPRESQSQSDRTEEFDFSLAETLRTDPHFPTAYQTIETIHRHYQAITFLLGLAVR